MAFFPVLSEENGTQRDTRREVSRGRRHVSHRMRYIMLANSPGHMVSPNIDNTRARFYDTWPPRIGVWTRTDNGQGVVTLATHGSTAAYVATLQCKPANTLWLTIQAAFVVAWANSSRLVDLRPVCSQILIAPLSNALATRGSLAACVWPQSQPTAFGIIGQ